ncbi:MAG: VOC family protein [Chitinophagales bacterium]
MIKPIYPCLWFDGQAKEAAEFYCSLFQRAAITAETPMVVTFELNGMKFMGLNGGPHFKFNPAISIFVTCTSVSEIDDLWSRLTIGGKILMPIDNYPWSERYGWAQDKYGLTWQLFIAETADAEQKITPCLLFTQQQFGRAEEAICFYSSVFDNSSTQTLVHYPQGDANEGKVMFSEFKLADYAIIAMDGPGEHAFSFNEAFSFVVSCETQDVIDYYWNKLTEGGQEVQCGWLRDKFGISWQIIPSVLPALMRDPEKAEKVTQAFMQMKKLDIATLLKAVS